jgi:hypothetical protein
VALGVLDRGLLEVSSPNVENLISNKCQILENLDTEIRIFFPTDREMVTSI